MSQNYCDLRCLLNMAILRLIALGKDLECVCERNIIMDLNSLNYDNKWKLHSFKKTNFGIVSGIFIFKAWNSYEIRAEIIISKTLIFFRWRYFMLELGMSSCDSKYNMSKFGKTVGGGGFLWFMVYHLNSCKFKMSISETWWLCRWLHKVNLEKNMYIFSSNTLFGIEISQSFVTICF